ncbi:hypothetical protein DFP73DRAFT_181053 [Morchella snyderi]|nr:hypothetical protein DFP73DRAFT_181053 [Morchella snyderi]
MGGGGVQLRKLLHSAIHGSFLPSFYLPSVLSRAAHVYEFILLFFFLFFFVGAWVSLMRGRSRVVIERERWIQGRGGRGGECHRLSYHLGMSLLLFCANCILLQDKISCISAQHPGSMEWTLFREIMKRGGAGKGREGSITEEHSSRTMFPGFFF